jgi:hypothetical protein
LILRDLCRSPLPSPTDLYNRFYNR